MGFRLRPLYCVKVSLPSFEVLFAVPNNVGLALTGKQHQSKCEPRFRSDGMARLKLLNFLRCPCMEADEPDLKYSTSRAAFLGTSFLFTRT